jgi:hypothetical protein
MMEQITQDIEPLVLLKYFSIFRHPLTLEELLRFSSDRETSEGLAQYLLDLERAGTIKQVEGYYFYDGDESCLHKRREGERKAAALIPRAKAIGRMIALFPFVKFVGISGSLSKGYANDTTDFDFFIVTSRNTLWICRTMLHLVKKMSFLFKKQHWFCMNYFIDDQHLELEEQNIFTQIELSTLIPVYNTDMYHLLLLKNKKNLPNLGNLPVRIQYTPQLGKYIDQYNEPANKWWSPLNRFFMKLTDRKWRKKWQKRGYPQEDYALAFKTTPHISKNHPKNYQKLILKQLNKTML